MLRLVSKIMKGTKISKKLLASFVVCFALFFTVSAQTTINYSESDDVIANPERGLFNYMDDLHGKMIRLDLKELQDARINKGQTVLYRQYSLLNYLEKPLDPKYMAFLLDDAVIARKAGVKMIIRFSYSDKEVPDDCHFNSHDPGLKIVKQHISFLKDYFDKAKDVITLIQAGFIGMYGEWFYPHKDFGSCKEPNYQTRAEVLKLLLESIPGEIPVALRAPRYRTNIIALWKTNNLPQDQLKLFSARLGYYNDCFLDDATDQDTFINPQERKNLQESTKDLPMVGESCTTTHMKNSYAAWENAEKDLRGQHWSLLSSLDNGRFWTTDLFCTNKEPAKTGRCSKDKDCEQGEKCISFTRWNEQQYKVLQQKLGYRLFLTQTEFAEAVKAGDKLDVKIVLSNSGWAAPFSKRAVEVFMCRSDSEKCTEDEKRVGDLGEPVDIRKWYSAYDRNTPIKVTATIATNGLASGTYDLYFRLADSDKVLSKRPEYSIRFANQPHGRDQSNEKRSDVFGWNEMLGANRFARVVVK